MKCICVYINMERKIENVAMRIQCSLERGYRCLLFYSSNFFGNLKLFKISWEILILARLGVLPPPSSLFSGRRECQSKRVMKVTVVVFHFTKFFLGYFFQCILSLHVLVLIQIVRILWSGIICVDCTQQDFLNVFLGMLVLRV